MNLLLPDAGGGLDARFAVLVKADLFVFRGSIRAGILVTSLPSLVPRQRSLPPLTLLLAFLLCIIAKILFAGRRLPLQAALVCRRPGIAVLSGSLSILASDIRGCLLRILLVLESLLRSRRLCVK